MNEYEDVLNDLMDEELYTGARIAAGNIAAQPDQAAKALQLAQLTGQPAPIIYNQLPQAEMDAKIGMASQIIAGDPTLSKFIEDEYFASIVGNDDYGNLANFTQSARRTNTYLGALQEAGRQTVNAIGSIPTWRILGATLEEAGQGFGSDSIGGWAVKGLNEWSPGFAERNRTATAAWALLGMPFELAIRGMGAMGGAIAGGVRQTAKEFGADTNTADSLAREAIGIMESMGGMPTALHMEPPSPRAKIAAESARNWVENGKEVPRGVDPLIDEIKAETNTRIVEEISEDVAMAQASQLRARSPELFSKLAELEFKDAEIGISGEAVRALYADRIPEAGDGILGWVPDLAGKMEVAFATGGDIRVPVKDLVANIDPALFEQLKPDLRAWDGGVTAREVEIAKAEPVEPRPAQGTILDQVREASGMESVVDRVANVKLTKTEAADIRRQAFETSNELKESRALYDAAHENQLVNNRRQIALTEQANKEGKKVSDNPEYIKLQEEWIELKEITEARLKEYTDLQREVGAKAVAEAEAKLKQEATTEAPERGPFDMLKADAVGIDQVTYDRLQKLILERNAQDFEAATKRQAAIEKKKLGREWRKLLEETRVEVRGEIEQRPEIMADIFMSTGEINGIKFRQRFSLGTEYLTPEQIEALPRSYVSKDGLPPNEIANMFGFADGGSLIDALTEVRAARGGKTIKEYIDARVTEEAKTLMERRHGNLDDNIMDAAKEQALSETGLQVLEEDMYAAAMKAGEGTMDRVTAKMYSEELFDKMQVKDIKSDSFVQRVGKLAMDAFKSAVKGDWQGALHALERRTLTAQMAKMAVELEKAQAELDATAKPYQKRETENVAVEFVSQIQGLLKDAGYKIKLSEEEIARGQEFHGTGTLAEFVDRLEADGFDLPIADFIREGKVRPVKEMTAAEFHDFKLAIDAMDAVGRLINKIRIAGEQADWAEVKREIISTIKELPLRDAKAMGERGNIFFGLASEFLKPETVIRQLDQGERGGPLWQATIPELEKGKAEYYRLQEDLAQHFRDTNAQLGKRWRESLDDEIKQDFIHDPRTNNTMLYDMNRNNLIQIMLHFGSRENIKQIVNSLFYNEVGRKPKPDEARAFELRLKKLIDDNATKEDWQFVEALWKPFKEWQPLIDRVARNTTGRPPKLVKAEPIDTPHGVMSGGYWPVRYDRLRSSIDAVRAPADSVFDHNYFRAATAKQYLKTRKGSNMFIDIEGSIEGALGRMQQTMFDVSFREGLMQAAKVFYDPQISNAIKNHYGVEFERQFKPWLKDFAAQYSVDNVSLGTINRGLRWARLRLTSFALPLSLGVLLSPAPGRVRGNFISRTGYFRDEKANHALVMQHSSELKHMLYNMDRDYREAMMKITTESGYSDIARKFVEKGFKASAYIEEKFRAATFYEEFQKGKAKGLTDSQAAQLADSAVREWHGVSHPLDLAPAFRGSEATKFLTLFQGFFNTIFNKTYEIPSQFRRGEYREITDTAVSLYVMGAAINMVLNPPKNDESILKWAAKNMGMTVFSQLPGVSHIGSYLMEGYQPRFAFMAFVQAFKDGWNDAIKAAEGKPVKKPITHAANIVGLAAGLPLAQAGRTAQFGVDMYTGKQRVSSRSPQNIFDYMRGIRSGESQPRR